MNVRLDFSSLISVTTWAPHEAVVLWENYQFLGDVQGSRDKGP